MTAPAPHRIRIPLAQPKPRFSELLGSRAFVSDDQAPGEADALFLEPPTLSDRETPWTLAQLLPEPGSVQARWIVLAPTATPRGLVARWIGNPAKLSRAVRGAALLLRGYRDVGGGIDRATGLDLAWARVPGRGSCSAK